MPYINGVLGVKLIRQINQKVPIIVLTIEGVEDIAEKFFEAGANDFSIKPIKVLDLYSRVNIHLKNNTNDKIINDKKYIISDEYYKGINNNTIDLIQKKMLLLNEYSTIEEISEITGLATQTINKYMNYLLKMDFIDMKIIYGKVGRPKNKYLWKQNLSN